MTAARALSLLIRVTGAGALLLGVALWAGYGWGWSLLPWHLALGVGLVLSMWILAAVAWRAGTRRGLATAVFLWGLAILAFGLVHGRILPGQLHWTISTAHLLVGAIAIGLGGSLARAVDRMSAIRP
jgi:hypothetical protein